jgi:transporter family protein
MMEVGMWFLWATLATVFWAGWAVLAKASGLGWRELTAWSVLPQAALALVLFIGGRISWESSSTLLALASGTSAFLGGVLFYAALQHGPSAAVIPLTSLYPALAVLLAVVFLHEPVSARQVAGIVAAFLAAVLLAGE